MGFANPLVGSEVLVGGTVTAFSGPQQSVIASGTVPAGNIVVNPLPSWVNQIICVLGFYSGSPEPTLPTQVAVAGNPNSDISASFPMLLNTPNGPMFADGVSGGVSPPIPVFPAIDTELVINFTPLGAIQGAKYWILGSNAYEQESVTGQIVTMRADNRTLAIGRNVSPTADTATTNVNVIAAPTAPARILLAAGWIMGFTNNASGAFDATVAGVLADLAFVNGLTSSIAVPLPPAGLLCDIATPVIIRYGGGQVLAQATYDIVT